MENKEFQKVLDNGVSVIAAQICGCVVLLSSVLASPMCKEVLRNDEITYLEGARSIFQGMADDVSTYHG